uniref:Serpin domain-containing protein n=1 Tax=Oreochromis aureus TaxID=47969 RepID=A0AAZ1Y045_OREAU
MSAVSSSNTAFALELFRTLSQTNPAGNIFVSPLSISSALAMVYLGAKGDTAAQMAQVSSLSLVICTTLSVYHSGEGVHADFQKLNADINSPSASYILKLANRLYGENTAHFLPNETVPVQMMHQRKKLPYNYIADHDLQILELPYVAEELSMFILLPKELNEWTDRKNMSTYSEVILHLPKFKLEEDYELNEPLAKLGMKDVFCAGRADLSGMNGEGGLFLSTVAHKAFVEVNEEGTEAAAATGAAINACCYIPDTHFRADHPFLFFIRHNKTKSILFFGRFSSPQ